MSTLSSSKKTQSKKARLRKECDSLLQHIFVKENPYCLVCGKPTHCGHHYFPKSTASALRYVVDNLIPVCAGCHVRHHNGDPRPQRRIDELKGKKWYNDLLKLKEAHVSDTIGYYEQIKEELEKYV